MSVAQAHSWIDRAIANYDDYRAGPGTYGMTTSRELCLLETYARERFTGSGRIVDLGCWYGATTVSLARGLAGNRRAAGNRMVHAFDLFEWHPWMEPLAEQASLPARYSPGDSFQADVQALLGPLAPLVRLERQDLTTYVPADEPIEFLFIDAMKNWELAAAITSRFLPLTIRGGYVVQQDFAYYYPEIATNHLIMWLLREHFQPRHHVPHSCSVVFECVRRVEHQQLPPLTPMLFTDDMVDDAYRYATACVSRDMRVMVEFAKLHFLLQQGRAAGAARQLLTLGDARGATEPMLRMTGQIAGAAVAEGRLESATGGDVAAWLQVARARLR